MTTHRPLRAIGLRLGARLYLLFAAILVPTFWVYYVAASHTLEDLHADEVDSVIRLCVFRIEDGLAAFGPLEELGEPEREELNREIRRIAQETPGVVEAAAFCADGLGGFKFLAGSGSAPGSRPTEEDLTAAVQNRTLTLDVVRGEQPFLAVSAPHRLRNDVRGALHLVVSPDRVGLGPRLPALRKSLLLGPVALMVGLAVLVAFYFHFTVGRPIRRLIAAMERAAEGDLGAVVDIPGGEFGLLARSYNQMMLRLRSSMEENRKLLATVRGFNEGLREKIEVATRELAAKNTALQDANEKLFLLQRQMTTLEKLATLGQIAALIAHELGTPLNAISGHLQLLLQDPLADPALRGRLQVIDVQVDRLAGIVRGVLRAMRVPPPRYETVDVRRVVEAVVDLFTPVVAKRGVAVGIRWRDDLPPIQADADQLQQVFMNLFSNAIDAMRNGGSLTVAADFVHGEEGAGSAAEPWSSAREGHGLRIEVSDTGEGMDEETARRVFDPFFTTKESGGPAEPRSSVGLGLGLSICRQIVKNHAGDIAVRSERGKGTTFILWLPVAPKPLLAHGVS